MLDGGDDVTQKNKNTARERTGWERATLAGRVKYLKPQQRRTPHNNRIQRIARTDVIDGSQTKCSNYQAKWLVLSWRDENILNICLLRNPLLTAHQNNLFCWLVFHSLTRPENEKDICFTKVRSK